jgi:hypothetical protein
MDIGDYAMKITPDVGEIDKNAASIKIAAAVGAIDKEAMSFIIVMPNGSWSSRMHIGMLGDVNNDGEVNIIDYTLIRYHYRGLQLLTGANLVRGDVNRDGVCDETDCALVGDYII